MKVTGPGARVNSLRIETEFRPGIEDIIILPAVATALAVKALAKSALSVLIHILDYIFFIAMELARFPLFAVRALGDGVIAILRGLLTYLPLPQDTRLKWRSFVAQKWARIRQAISYKAFEQAVHHAFERGMEWVFRKCRTLPPRTAFYVIVAAVLWLPISVGAATAMHTLLLTNAASLPAWMQLHPFATMIAKTKLLVLPVYPAAWPQAKKHPVIQTIAKAYRDFESLFFIQKMEHRYRQTEQAIESSVNGMHRFADRIGLSNLCIVLWNAVSSFVMRSTQGFRRWLRDVFERFSQAWLIGPVISSYASHLASIERRNDKISEKVKRGFDRWFVKFSAEYYEAKDAEHTAKAAAEALRGLHPASSALPVKPSESG